MADVHAQVGLGKVLPQQPYNAFLHYLKLHKENTDPGKSMQSTNDSPITPSLSSKTWNTYAQNEWEATKKKIAKFYSEEAEEAQHAFEHILERLLMISHPNRREAKPQAEHV